MDANPHFRCRRRGAPIRPRGRRVVDAGRTPECVRGRAPLWRGPPGDCDRVLASLRGHRSARLAFPDRALPTLAATRASANQMGGCWHRCRDGHATGVPGAGWMGMGRDPRTRGNADRRRVRGRPARPAGQSRDRHAALSALRRRRSHQPDIGLRGDGDDARGPLHRGHRRIAGRPPSVHARRRAPGGPHDARCDRAVRADPRASPACRRWALLPQPLRRDSHARLARCPATRPGRPRGAACRAARRGPRHDAARARQPLAAGACKVMAVAGRPRILLRGSDRAELASVLGALGDVTTDAALLADLIVFTATVDESLAELRRVAAHDDGAWRPLLVIAPDDGLCIASLDAGADAVVGPRVESAELVARVRALLRIKARHDAVEKQAAQSTDWTQSLVSRVAEQVEELQRVERLRRFLAPQVAQVVAHDEGLLESHRREIAAVFCDLRGFTAFSEVAEPEEVMGVLREYHDALGALVFEYEATLERFAGDAILAFFNDPVPCPDPAARAVRMAVAMRERVSELVAGWRKRGYDLDFGVGIALGYATPGRIGFAGRSDYGAVGTVVNLAARLCAEAQGGQILLSERAHTLVEDLVEAEPLAPLPLKGFLRPVKAVNVVALRAER